MRRCTARRKDPMHLYYNQKYCLNIFLYSYVVNFFKSGRLLKLIIKLMFFIYLKKLLFLAGSLTGAVAS